MIFRRFCEIIACEPGRAPARRAVDARCRRRAEAPLSVRVHSPAFRARHAGHHPQRQRHPLRRAQGLRALARARRAVGRRVPAGTEGTGRRRAEVPAGAAQVPRVVPSGASRRATRAWGSTRARPRTFAHGLRQPRVRPEGRYLRADFRDLSVISLYLPSGSSRAAPAGVEVPLPRGVPAAPRRRLRKSGREIILCGDWNIAHQPIDLKNWRSNQKNSGFLPEERAWLTQRVRRTRLRRRVPHASIRGPEQYTWWSNRGASWAKNVGWRIDYQIATPGHRATRAGPRRSTRTGASPITRR